MTILELFSLFRSVFVNGSNGSAPVQSLRNPVQFESVPAQAWLKVYFKSNRCHRAIRLYLRFCVLVALGTARPLSSY